MMEATIHGVIWGNGNLVLLILTSTIDRSGWSASHPDGCTPEERALIPMKQEALVEQRKVSFLQILANKCLNA
jgi:hypothetical protein